MKSSSYGGRRPDRREQPLPTNLPIPGHNYRVRVRCQNNKGMWSRWSVPLELAVPARREGDPKVLTKNRSQYDAFEEICRSSTFFMVNRLGGIA